MDGDDDGAEALRRAVAHGAAFAAVLCGAAAAWYANRILAPILLGVLFGIFLSETAGWLRRAIPVPQGLAVALTVAALAAAAVAAAVGMGVSMADQLSRLAEMLPQGLAAGRQWLARNPPLHAMLEKATAAGGEGSALTAVRGAGTLVTAAAEGCAGAVVVFFTGLFVAYSPEFYSQGLLRLVPPRHRERGARVLSELWRSLWLWTLGRLLVMAAIAAAHVAAYWLLGVPLPLVLGVLAGVLSFVPYLGPIVATIPAALVALTKSPSLMLWVIVAHAAVEIAESNLLTPIAQAYWVEVPALVTIFAVLVFGRTMGVSGLLIATPMAAVAMVLVRELYVRGLLEGDPEGD